ncbi:hypothetical protein FA04_29580 (plasmid) [Ensifer adhaerens]|nr:hypothetical protein FA04_29580 [Ensifer adhaerens]KDP75427.1 hypothetical protein FA04_01145 [Ensifer adhaerens]KQX24751.1 hypothetical protein ASD01_27095 [Ensifer sp. Root423]
MSGVNVVVQAPPNAQNIVIANQRMTLTVAAIPSPIPFTIDCNSTHAIAMRSGDARQATQQ